MTVPARRIRFAQPLGQFDNPEIPIRKDLQIRGLGVIPFFDRADISTGAVVAIGALTTVLSGIGAVASFHAIGGEKKTGWKVADAIAGSILVLSSLGGVSLIASGLTMPAALTPAGGLQTPAAESPPPPVTEKAASSLITKAQKLFSRFTK